MMTRCTEECDISDIKDEIALEGLDGITLQGLWLRLENRPNFCHGRPIDKLKSIVWELIVYDSDLTFYKLPQPRPDLVIHNRYEFMDPELGIVMEQSPSNTVDIYPFHKVENRSLGEMGSCQHYATRTDITDEVCCLTLGVFEQRFPSGTVVIVASQKTREEALGIDSHVEIFNPLTLAQYCILERIGRTRTMGDVTQGKHGMTMLGDAKSLFYHRKRLLRLQLITKQSHLQKGIKGASQTGSLLHLTRFYVERKSKFVLLIEHCVELLHASPNCSMPVAMLKESLGLPEPSCRKLLKNPELLKYIEFVNLKFTSIYPDKPRKESHGKHGKERQVRCARLVDPSLRATDVYCGKEDVADPDEDDDDEPTAGILMPTKIVWLKRQLQQAYSVVLQSGPGGITQRGIGSQLSQSRLDSRTICRNLERCHAVGMVMRDVGRQRVTHFVARPLLPDSHLTREFTHEKQRLMQLINKTAEPAAPTQTCSTTGDQTPSSTTTTTTRSNSTDQSSSGVAVEAHKQEAHSATTNCNKKDTTVGDENAAMAETPVSEVAGPNVTAGIEGDCAGTNEGAADGKGNRSKADVPHMPSIQLDESATIINLSAEERTTLEQDQEAATSTQENTPGKRDRTDVTSALPAAKRKKPRETTTMKTTAVNDTKSSTPVKLPLSDQPQLSLPSPVHTPVSNKLSLKSLNGHDQHGLSPPTARLAAGNSRAKRARTGSMDSQRPGNGCSLAGAVSRRLSTTSAAGSDSSRLSADDDDHEDSLSCPAQAEHSLPDIERLPVKGREIKREFSDNVNLAQVRLKENLLRENEDALNSCSYDDNEDDGDLDDSLAGDGTGPTDTELQAAMFNALNFQSPSQFLWRGSDPSASAAACDTEYQEDQCSLGASEVPHVTSITQDCQRQDDPTTRYEKFVDASQFVSTAEGKKRRVTSNITTKMLRRTNIILEMVRQQRVVADVFKLQKTILEYEQNEGYRVDKKSVNRLLDRLGRCGLLKTLTVTFNTQQGRKQNKLIVDNNVKLDDIYLTSIIEQLKLKFIPPQVRNEAKSVAVATVSVSADGQTVPGESADTAGSEQSLQLGPALPAASTCSASSGRAEEPETAPHQLLPHTSPNRKKLVKEEEIKKDVPTDGPTSSPTLGRLGPKFKRMQDLHQLLFYLVRDYTGDPMLDQDRAWQQIHQDNPTLGPQDPCLPRIYSPELSWRMFIPPIPRHVTKTEGWGFMCDVVLRLPLYLFVRIIRCSITQELLTWLQHPVKKFVLIKMLPSSVRSVLLEGRRYVHNFMELINRLCYMGLVQLGEHVSKQRDQRFVYLNRHARILDTRLSGPGYHQISQDRDYTVTNYTFTDMATVHQFWYDMLRVCLNTPLGGQRAHYGQDITVQYLVHKPQMQETLTTRQFTEAPKRDTGVTPGDGKGAAGLDCTMFAHLKRNWSFSLQHSAERAFTHQSMFDPSTMVNHHQDDNDDFGSCLLPESSGRDSSTMVAGGALYHNYLMSTTQQQQQQQGSAALQPPHPSARLPSMRKLAVYKSRNGEEKVEEVGVAVLSRDDKKRRKFAALSKLKASKRLSLARGKKTSYQRRFKPRPKVPKKPYYDEEDRAALGRMKKLRVEWSTNEDSLLLLCKAASCYLLPSSPRPRMLPFTLVRNILHKRFPESKNKTTRACQRRINYVMKDATTADNVAITVEEVRQDPYIKERFLPPGIPQNKENLESVYGTIFIELVEHLVNKFKTNSNRVQLELPNSFSEFLEQYSVIPAKSIKPALTYTDPKNKKEVHFHTIQTLLYSSLCCRADRESYAYQLYQAYNQFSQQMLYNALGALRTSQMISYKKCYNRSINSQMCLPLSTSPYQLSMSYIHKFVTKYQYEAFGHCWSLLTRLVSSYYKAYAAGKKPEDLVKNSDLAVPLMRDKNNEGGCIAALIEQTSIKRLIMHTFLPETIIIIDTNRTITSQLPYQKSNIPRRVTDLAEASGKTVDLRAVSSFSGNQPPSSRISLAKSKRSNEEMDDLNETQQSNIRRMKLHSSDLDASSNTVDNDGPAVDDQSFDDSFDLNDETLDVFNQSSESIEKSQQSDEGSSSSWGQQGSGGGPVNKRLKELQGDQSQSSCRKRRLSPSITISGGSPAKKLRATDECSATSDGDSGDSCKAAAGDAQDTDNDTETEAGDVRMTPDNAIQKINSRSRHVTSASRLSVFMKDQNTISLLENQEIGSGGPALLQHMQDNLLLTACDVTCQLTVPPTAGLPPPSPDGDGYGLSQDQLALLLLSVDRKHQAEVLSSYRRGEMNMDVSLDAVLQQWRETGHSEQILALVRDIHAFVDTRGVAGATRADIQEWRRGCGGGAVMAVVEEMEAAGLLLREGVAHHTWLSLRHARDAWLVHTQHLSRQERQSLRLHGVYCMKVEAPATEAMGTDNTSGAMDSPADGTEDMNNSTEGTDNPTVGSDITAATENPSAADTASNHAAAVVTGSESRPEAGAAATSSNMCTAADSSHANSTDDSSIHLPTAGVRDEPSTVVDDVADDATSCSAEEADEENHGSETGPSCSKTESTSRGAELGRVRSLQSQLTRHRYTKDQEESRMMEQKVHEYQDSERREHVFISLRPWVRIYGSLNRRVLDRMLGTVLFLVMEQPGISGQRVAQHLAPALLPVHVHELLHLLQRLHCLTRINVTLHDQPSALFTGSTMMPLKDEAGAEFEEDDVCYLPTVDCMSRLAVFIGDKKYARDFLSDDRR